MLGSRTTVEVAPLFDDGGAALVALARRSPSYRTYSSHEKVVSPVGEGLPQRFDSVRNFLRSGREVARTSYFREEYAYGGQPLVEGIEPFLHHGGLVDAARQVHGRPVIEPSIAYANVMLPGQELAVHTDVPEFRGLNRKLVPQWLLVVMHHSELFDAWRMPIATGIAWFSDGPGGELALWPEGPDGACVVHPAGAGTALVLDTDTLFHGVQAVGGDGVAPPPVTGDAELVRLDGTGSTWQLVDAASGDARATYEWDELRLSVSWKAYCFVDEAERDAWRTHADDLTEAAVLDRLVADLRDRGVVSGPDPVRDRELGLLLVDTYVRFPTPA